MKPLETKRYFCEKLRCRTFPTAFVQRRITMDDTVRTSAFGKDIRNKEFVLQPGAIFLNHGYKGAVPKPVIEVQDQFINLMRRRPSNFFMRRKFPLWKKARDAAAEFLRADPQDLFLVQNVTTGMSTILNCITLNRGECILTTNNTFGAVRNACITKAGKSEGVEVDSIAIEFPIENEDEVVDLYRKFFVEHLEVKLAVIDYISCPSAMKFPVEKIVKLCKEYKVISIVDGAHTPGQIPIDLSTFEADFFTANFHKWAFAPWGCAIIWKNKNYECQLKPLASSTLQGSGALNEFFMQGTRDESAFFSLPAALQFIEDIGGLTKIREYNIDLIEKGTDYLTSMWHTEKLPMPSSLEAPFLRMIRMPNIPGYEEPSQEAAERLMKDIYDSFDIDVCVKYTNNLLYLRLSIHIHNSMEDIVKLGNAVSEMSERRTRLFNG